jgi:acyl-CoA thioesterase FadM
MENPVSRVNTFVGYGDTGKSPHMSPVAYPWHFEQGRQDLLEISGLNPISLEPRGISIRPRKDEYTYHRSIHEGDELVIETFFDRTENCRFLVAKQRMLHNGKVAAESETRYAFFSLRTGDDIPLPLDIERKYGLRRLIA